MSARLLIRCATVTGQDKVCGHFAFEHHFNGYDDVAASNLNNGSRAERGAQGRGKCAHNTPMVEQFSDGEKHRCPCHGFTDPAALLKQANAVR